MNEPSAAPVLVVAPLSEEMAALRARLAARRPLRRGPLRGHAGRLDGTAVHAVVVGDGAARAAAALDAWLAASTPPVRAVLVIGVAGGLSPDVDACDVLVGERIETRTAAAPALAPDAAWVRRLPTEVGRRARLVSVERIVAGTAEKQALARALGPTALAVDLESAALVEVAHRHAVPSLVLRSISDTLAESLPGFMRGCFRADGTIRRGRVLLALLRKPRRLRALRIMARRMQACAEALADAATIAVQCAP